MLGHVCDTRQGYRLRERWTVVGETMTALLNFKQYPPGTRRIVPLDKQLRSYCTKCQEPTFATHRQIMVTVVARAGGAPVRGEPVWRTIQYCCDVHAEELAKKWDIQLEKGAATK
jgi:hypothetical protein